MRRGIQDGGILRCCKTPASALVRFFQLSLERRAKPGKIIFEQIVIGALLHCLDANFIADGARNKEERNFAAPGTHHFQGTKAIESRQAEVRNHHLPIRRRQRIVHLRLALDAPHLQLKTRVTQRVFQHQGIVFRIFNQQ